MAVSAKATEQRPAARAGDLVERLRDAKKKRRITFVRPRLSVFDSEPGLLGTKRNSQKVIGV